MEINRSIGIPEGVVDVHVSGGLYATRSHWLWGGFAFKRIADGLGNQRASESILRIIAFIDRSELEHRQTRIEDGILSVASILVFGICQSGFSGDRACPVAIAIRKDVFKGVIRSRGIAAKIDIAAFPIPNRVVIGCAIGE